MSVGTANYHCVSREMSSSDSQNLQAIQAALDLHSEHCLRPALAIAMSPYEVERLGWDEFRGLPIVADPEMGTGRVRIICEEQDGGGGLAGLELVYGEGDELDERPEIANAVRRMLDRYGQ